MIRKCRSCLCWTCLNMCKCMYCKGKVQSCKDYNNFRQISIFDQKIKQSMNILIACEESQRVCIEFRKLGHEAYSCDIELCSGGHPEWHIQADVLPILNGDCSFQTADGTEYRVDGKWDMIIAFPPCTHLAVSGARYFAKKQKDGRQQQGIDFFMEFTYADCKKIAIENPVGVMSSRYRKPDQIIQPYEFGEPERKTTCLWLKGLPKLHPTEIIEPKIIKCASGAIENNWHMETLPLKPKERSKLRSKTFLGIAKAMAEQWGNTNKTLGSKFRSAPRHSWQHYGISKERCRQLTEYIQSGRYASLASQAAHRANKDIAECILLSVTQNKSYDTLEKLWARGEIGRIPYGKTDFYGIRRYFYHLFDLEVRRIGK